MLFWIFYVKSNDGIMRLISVENGAQEMKIKGGSQSISNFLAKQLKNTKLNCPVKQIEYNNEGATISINSTRKETSTVQFKCKKVILAFSPTLYSKIFFAPSLPCFKSCLSDNLPMGSIIKTNTFYNTAFWRVNGLNGQFLSREGPVYYAIDDTKHDGKYPSIMVFFLLFFFHKIFLKINFFIEK